MKHMTLSSLLLKFKTVQMGAVRTARGGAVHMVPAFCHYIMHYPAHEKVRTITCVHLMDSANKLFGIMDNRHNHNKQF